MPTKLLELAETFCARRITLFSPSLTPAGFCCRHELSASMYISLVSLNSKTLLGRISVFQEISESHGNIIVFSPCIRDCFVSHSDNFCLGKLACVFNKDWRRRVAPRLERSQLSSLTN